ncbi:MAG: hypothetical protein WDN46_15950 [Methylocella sp.]
MIPIHSRFLSEAVNHNPPVTPTILWVWALALAINDLADAEQDLKVAHDACRIASDNKFAAIHVLDEVRDEIAASGDDDFAVSLMGSLRGGEAFDVSTLDRPAAEKRAREEAAAYEVDNWRKTQIACEAAIPDKEREVSESKRRVEIAAREVIQASGAVACLTKDLDMMQAEVVRRRDQLHYLYRTDADKDRIRKILRDDLLPGGISHVEIIDWRRHEDHIAWQEAFAALSRDPDAVLPIYDNKKDDCGGSPFVGRNWSSSSLKQRRRKPESMSTILVCALRCISRPRSTRPIIQRRMY